MSEEEKEKKKQELLAGGMTEDEANAYIASMSDDDNSENQGSGTPAASPESYSDVAQLTIDNILKYRESGASDELLIRAGYTQHELDAATFYANGGVVATPEPATEDPERERKYNEYYNYYVSIGFPEDKAQEKAYADLYLEGVETIAYNPDEDPEYQSILNSGNVEQVSLGAEIQAFLKETENPLKNDNVDSMSKLDYIATYAASGKYNKQQLLMKVSSLDFSDCTFAPHPSRYFTGTQYEDIYNYLASSGDFKQKANHLNEEIKLLKKEYATAHEAFESWRGSASQLELQTMENIMLKFDSTISDLEKSLKPSCDGLNKLKGLLEKLRDNEKKLFQLTGVDGDGLPLASQTKDCLYLLQKQQEELQKEYDSSVNSYNNLSNNPEYDDNNRTTSAYNKNLSNAKNKMNSDKAKLDKINKDIENKEKQIEKMKTDLDKILEDVIMTIFDINEYDKNLQSFESYLGFDPGNKGQPNEHYTDWDSFKTHTMYNYRDLMLDNSYDNRIYNNDNNNSENQDEKTDIYSQFEDMFNHN